MAERSGENAAHDEHDLLAVAALLDDASASGDRQAGEALVASCPECAALHADLLALSSATAELPIPARPRDFRLTTADAARLTAAPSREPVAPAARLAGVMTDRPIPAGHAGHDQMLVASLVDHSLGASERAAAEALVASCTACADLHADLQTLRDATRALPTPVRPRDFALTPDDAARLRRGGWRRIVAAFGSSRDVFSRPLAVGLTTLGLAGLLLVSVPSMVQFGGSTAVTLSTVGNRVGDVPQPEVGTDSNGAPVAAGSPEAAGAPIAAPAASAIPAAVASAAPPVQADASAAPAPVASAPGQDAFGPVQGAGGAAAPPSAADFGIKGAPSRAADLDSGGATTAAPGVPILLVASGLFLVAGLALFAIRWSARRLGDG